MTNKYFIIDFFKLSSYDEVNITELKRVLIFTSVSESKILCRHYEVNPGSKVNETDV